MEKCVLLGTMTILAGHVLTVGQGVTFSVDAKAKLVSYGTIAITANGTLASAGKITTNPGAMLVNSGVFSASGTFVNYGVFVNSEDAVLKNAGRITNNATINNQGYIENRGILALSEEAVLASSAGAKIKNSGRVMVYCGAEIAVGAVSSGRPVTDKCDDPPAAVMGQWFPSSPMKSDGNIDTAFTFRATATDDIKLAKLEWDFDGDGIVDYARPLSGRSVMTTATHVYGERGIYHPQVRAVDSAGAKSAWDRYGFTGLDAAAAIANVAPMAPNIAMSTEQDVPLVCMLEAKDLDGDRLTFSLAALPEHGVLLGDAPGLSYIPDEGYVGQDSFTFTASDGNGGESRPAKVWITVGRAERALLPQIATGTIQPPQGVLEELEMPDNSKPVAPGQFVSTTEEVPAPIRLAATDADGDWLEFKVVSDPRAGMLSGTAPDLTYTPDAEFYGQDSFTFMASDSFGGSATATVTVIVNPVNDMPVAYDDSASTAQNTPVSIDVLANDEDVEVEFLSIASVSSPRSGSATPGGGGFVTYLPNAGFTGADSFTYTVSDGDGGTATATVAVIVAAMAALPPAPTQAPAPVPQPAPSQLYCGRQVSSFAQVIGGTEGDDSLTGTLGDDLIIGYGGSDVLRGRAGDDCIVGGPGNDRMYGDGGMDILEGGDGDDSMWGGAGDDEMWGGAGSDKVIGDAGVDLLYGDDGDDRMWGGADNDAVFAGAGNDRLVGDGGDDVMDGEAGDDSIYDDVGDDTIDGGDGDNDGCWDIVGSNQITGCEGR